MCVVGCFVFCFGCVVVVIVVVCVFMCVFDFWCVISYFLVMSCEYVFVIVLWVILRLWVSACELGRWVFGLSCFEWIVLCSVVLSFVRMCGFDMVRCRLMLEMVYDLFM